MGSMTSFIHKKSLKGVLFFIILLLFPIMAANAGSWTWIGPDAGFIDDIVPSPGFDQDQTVFSATKGNGVLKSTDGGKNWSHASDGLESLNVISVRVSSNFTSDHTLYAATAAGVFRSTNSASSWKNISNGLTTLEVDSIMISPSFSSDSTLLAGTNGGGVFISIDGGSTWTAANSGLSNLYINSIAISPSFSSDGTIFVATMAGVFKSINKGSTWAAINGGITSLAVNAVVISPSFGSDKTVFAGTAAGGVFKTVNGGSSWTASKTGFTTVAISAMALSPNYSSDGTLFAGTDDGGVFTSTNGGTSWTPGDSALANHRILSIVPSTHFSTDRTLFVGTRGHGIFKQSGSGNPWDHSEDGMRNINLVAEAVSPNFLADKTVYSATEDRGIFKTTNGGSTWVEVNSGLPSLRPTSLVISPNYALDNTLFAGFQGQGIYKSADGGTSWTPVNNGVSHKNVEALGISPNFGADQTLLAGTKGGGFGVYLSVDGGSSWTAVNSGITKPDVNSFGFSPNFSGDHTVFAGTAQGGIYKSTNGGSSWSAVNSGLTELSVSAIAVSPNFSVDSILYVGTSSGGVFKSANKGSSWSAVNTGLTNLSVSSLAISPVYASKPTLFVGTSGSGVYETLNGGTQWGQVNNNLSNLSINTLGISPGYPCDGTLFGGTEGSSGWRYTDTEAINVCVPPPPPPPSTPIINGISPAAGNTGSSVIISGSHFGASQGSSQVLFNGAPAAVSSGNWSDTQVIATVPSGATTGPVVVVVNNISSNGVTFTVTTVPPPSNPVISSLSPVSGAVGITVTISGSNFGSSQGSSQVLFNGVQASIPSGGWSSTQINAIVPSNATTGLVVVNLNGVSSNGINFTVIPPSPPPVLIPAISSLSPVSGTVGTQVTITGSNFGASQGSSNVLFNGAPAAVSSGNWSDTQIITTVPSGATSGLVTVTVDNNTSNGVSFTLTTPPPPASPVINNISPVSGYTGTAVTIYGSGFGSSQGLNTVLFNGLTADTIISWVDTQIVATVPAGATTGQLVVVVGGNSSNGVLFTVSTSTGNVVPVITNINPASAYFTTQVTITGYGFGATQGTSTVSFNGVLADTIISWSDTQIVVVVPAVASSGVPVVTVNGIMSTATGVNFVVYTGLNAPDLKVNSISGTVALTSIYVTDTEVNSGVSTAVPYFVSFYLSPVPAVSSNDVLIGTRKATALLGGGVASSGTTRLLVPPTMPIGNYYLCAIADSTNQVAETLENNNTLCTTTTLAVSPDVKSFSLSGALSSTSIVVSDTVINIGDQPAGAFSNAFYFSVTTTPNPSTDYLIGTRNINALAGGSAVNSASVTYGIDPTMPVGNYYLCAIADSNFQVAELQESGNNKCTTAVLAVSPDLKVNSISGALSGTNISVSDTEINSGDQLAGPFTVAFYFATTTTPNPSTDVLIGSRDLTGLAGGSSTNSATLNWPIPPTMPIGNYYLCAISDSANTVPELLETDNTKCTTVTFAIAPDLKGSGLTGTLSGATITASDTQINSGDQPAGPFTVAFYFAVTSTPNPSTDLLIGSRSITGLAGASATNSATTALAVPSTMAIGNYYLCTIADSPNQVAELVENNNSKCTTTTYAVSPDLQVSAISGTLSGTTLSVSDTQKNAGDQPAGAFKVAFYLAKTSTLSTLTDVMIGSRNIASLGVGATNLATTALPVPPTMTPAQYYLCSASDWDGTSGTIGELLENNNNKCGTTLYTISPDLTVSALTASLSGTSKISATDTQKNSGSQPAGAFTAAFYLQKTTTLNTSTDVQIGSRSISSLGVGATNSATTLFAIPPTMPAGNYYLCSISDSPSQVVEFNETNNSKCTTGTYVISPDLTVSALTGSLSGTNISATDSIKNTGDQPIGNSFSVSYYFSLTSPINTASTGVAIGSRGIASLDAGATNSATTVMGIPPTMTKGNYYLCAIADWPANQVVEVAETNNSKCTTSTYAISPDLKTSSITASKSGTTVTVNDTQTNSGDQPAGAFTVSFYLSSNNTYETTDILLGSRSIASLDAVGAKDSASTPFTVPTGIAAGTYYVIAVSDSGNTVPEITETNNNLSTTTTIALP